MDEKSLQVPTVKVTALFNTCLNLLVYLSPLVKHVNVVVNMNDDNQGMFKK
jgi:hypothetical protein